MEGLPLHERELSRISLRLCPKVSDQAFNEQEISIAGEFIPGDIGKIKQVISDLNVLDYVKFLIHLLYQSIHSTRFDSQDQRRRAEDGSVRMSPSEVQKRSQQ